MHFTFAAVVIALVGLAAATPTPVEEKRLDCYNSCKYR
ncbi:hypothetical protein RSAG8_12829, partial [Rhizoctonia solani AG-8 WAC10335]